MTWKDFQIEKELYKEAWERMKASYRGDIRRYLDQSRIVVSAGREFELDADFATALADCPAFFVNPAQSRITDNWHVEVKFPYVDIDFIQELKSSPYCDKERTLMRPSSSSVILKG